MTIQTVTLPLDAAIEAAAAVIPHLSKDATTPIICAGQIVPDESNPAAVRLVGTDRYTVGAFELATVEDNPHTLTAALTVPRSLLEALAKITRAQLENPRMQYYRATVTHDDGDGAQPATVTLSIAPEWAPHAPEIVRTAPAVIGNYPPVMRLFPEGEPFALPADLRVNPEHFAKFSAYAKKYAKGEPLHIRAAREGDNTPLLVTVGGLRALVQPVMGPRA